MSWFPRPSSPVAALRDLAAFLRQRSPEKAIGALLAILTAAVIVLLFVIDSRMGLGPPPRYVEVEIYPANRTDADIIADQKKDQAEREAAMKERQRQFQELEKRLGIE